MEEIVYLFIDGGYLQTVYRDLFVPVFGTAYTVDYEAVKRWFSARRVFYYDCLDDAPKTDETEADFKARVQRQQDLFDQIDKSEGVHVRQGWLSPGKKRQQKEVDVLLAVDMLTHSFYKNMTKAVLLSGDRDFKPVVEAVVRLGTYVELAYDPRIGSKQLARSVDSERVIDIAALCDWIKLDKYDQRDKHFPNRSIYPNKDHDPILDMVPKATLLREGDAGQEKRPVKMYDINGVRYASVQIHPRDFLVSWLPDEQKLIGFLTKLFGEIGWQ